MYTRNPKADMIAAEFHEGSNLTEIAKRHHITRERARQLLMESTREPCPGECEDGWVILNPEWPNGDLAHRERCPYLGDEEYRADHLTFWKESRR